MIVKGNPHYSATEKNNKLVKMCMISLLYSKSLLQLMLIDTYYVAEDISKESVNILKYYCSFILVTSTGLIGMS